MSITSPEQITAVSGFPVLEVIPVIQTHADRVSRKRRLVFAMASVGVVTLGSCALVIYHYRDRRFLSEDALYNAFYNLKENPFRLDAGSGFSLYDGETPGSAGRAWCTACATRPELTVLVGEAGTGKTTLLQVLRDWLAKRQFVTALCTNPTLTREEFLDLLLAQLGISCPSTLKEPAVDGAGGSALRYQAEGRRSVLIVDEAHRLSPELLEEDTAIA